MSQHSKYWGSLKIGGKLNSIAFQQFKLFRYRLSRIFCNFSYKTYKHVYLIHLEGRLFSYLFRAQQTLTDYN